MKWGWDGAIISTILLRLCESSSSSALFSWTVGARRVDVHNDGLLTMGYSPSTHSIEETSSGAKCEQCDSMELWGDLISMRYFVFSFLSFFFFFFFFFFTHPRQKCQY